jgi:alpha-tubulin suppressor-like RCC1 family protein
MTGRIKETESPSRILGLPGYTNGSKEFREITGIDNIVWISTGTLHLVAVTSHGILFSFLIHYLGAVLTCGVNHQNQLGRIIDGMSAYEQITPGVVNLGTGFDATSGKATECYCGDRHSFIKFVKNDGSVHWFAFGANAMGQLGVGLAWDAVWELADVNMGRQLVFNAPRQVTFPAGVEIVSAAGGGCHSLFRSKDGSTFILILGACYAAGFGEYGQTGFQDFQVRSVPERVEIEGFVIEIGCGSEFSFVVVMDRGYGNNLFGFGQGEQFQLGNMNDDDDMGESLSEPTMIDVGGRVVLSAKGGTNHSMFIFEAI